jgi:hypothetical protein
MARACSTHWQEENTYRGLVRNPELRVPLESPGCRWKNNVEIDLKATGLEGVDSTGQFAGCS